MLLCKLYKENHPRKDATFKLKIVTILLGVAIVILFASLLASSCGTPPDLTFFVGALVIFSLSLLHLLCSLLDVFKGNFASRGVEFLFHLAAGGWLVFGAAGVLLTVGNSHSDGKIEETDSSVTGNKTVNPNSNTTGCGLTGVKERTGGATVGLLNGLVYFYVCWLLWGVLKGLRGRKNEEIEEEEEGVIKGIYLFCGVGRGRKCNENVVIEKEKKGVKDDLIMRVSSVSPNQDPSYRRILSSIGGEGEGRVGSAPSPLAVVDG